MFLTLFVSNEFSHNLHTHIRVELCSRVTFRSTLHRTLRTTNPGGALCVCVFTSLVAFRDTPLSSSQPRENQQEL